MEISSAEKNTNPSHKEVFWDFSALKPGTHPIHRVTPLFDPLDFRVVLNQESGFSTKKKRKNIFDFFWTLEISISNFPANLSTLRCLSVEIWAAQNI